MFIFASDQCKYMKNTLHIFDNILDGLFALFGLQKNPSKDLTTGVFNDTPANKIKSDLRKINSDFRKQLIRMRQEL